MRVLICNGRAGSTLMYAILYNSGFFKHDAPEVRGYEINNLPPEIFRKYPDVDMEFIESQFPKAENILVKIPEFSLIVDKLINNDTKIIVINRNLEDCVRSQLATKSEHKVKYSIERNTEGGLIKEMKELNLIENENDEVDLTIGLHALFHIKQNEPKHENIFYVDFNEWMENFVEVNKKIYDFLGIKYDDKEIEKWINTKNTKNITTNVI